MPSIGKKLEVYINESRPDFFSNEKVFEVRLKKSGVIKKVKEDEKLYLDAKEDKTFVFSDKKTLLWIELKALDVNKVRVVIEADLQNIGEGFYKSNVFDSFIINATEISLKQEVDLQNNLEFKKISAANWIGKDQFLLIKDPKDSKADKERLQLDKSIIYVKEGDLLIYKEDFWILATIQDNTNEYPIAKIKTINSKLLEIEAWDLSGNNKYVFVLSSRFKQNLNFRSDLIKNARRRTKTHISLMINNQRLIVREKDLLVKSSKRFKLLKKGVDLDEITAQEIFYFDKIENKNNRKYLIAYLFNSDRTKYQKIEIPIVSNKNHYRRKKR